MKTPALFIAIYIVLAGLVAAKVPLGKAPDEYAHIFYVQHLATTHTLPVFKPIGASKDPGYEFHQPPVYYAICAAVWNSAGPGAQNYLCRLVSILFGAATIGLIWGAARRVFDDSLAAYAAGFAALWPLHINVGAFAGNDAAAGFCCALMLYLMARGAHRGPPSLKLCAVLGAACGLGMLTKSSCLPVAVAAFGWAVFASRRGDKRVMLRNAAAVAGVAALICGPWLVRNSVLYGDPLAAKIFDEAFRNSSPRPGAYFELGVDFFTYVRALFTVMFCTAFGAFGGPNTALSLLNPLFGGPAAKNMALIQPTALLLLPCAAACGIASLGLVRHRPALEVDAAKRQVLVFWCVSLVFTWLAWVNFNLIQFQGQARYVHPALLPMAILGAYGWRALVGRGSAGRVLMAGFAVVLVMLTCLNVWGWRTLV